MIFFSIVFFQKSGVLIVLPVFNGELHWKTADLSGSTRDYWKNLTLDGFCGMCDFVITCDKLVHLTVSHLHFSSTGSFRVYRGHNVNGSSVSGYML